MAPAATMRLGDILLAARLISPKQLETALETQKRTGGRLGEVLCALGFVTEFDMLNTLADQLRYPFVPNPEQQIDPSVTALVSEDLAKKHRVVPLRLEGNTLVVAMADPLNFMAIDDLSLQSGRRVKPVVSPEKAVHRAMLKAYALRAATVDTSQPTEGGSRAYDLEEVDESGVVKLVNSLVTQALSQRATDIHVEPVEKQVRIRYRIDGALQEGAPLPKASLQSVLSRIKVMAGMDIAERRIPQDGRIEVELQGRRLDLRVSSVPTIYGEKVAIRILDRSATVLGLGELGLPADVLASLRAMLAKPNGLFLVTGPTGSGKSTTLMAGLSEINHSSRHIITVEDPVEYFLPGVNQVQVNNKAGLSFAAGLRAFLRQDPDVIMVGEVRDSETADIAVRAALTGHLVLSTLHTNQAAGAAGRLIDMGIEPFLLASSLVGVLSQRLVRRLCQRCREPYLVDREDPDYHLLESAGLAGTTMYRATGCGHCDRTGYSGRLALVELLPVNGAVRELVTQRAPALRIHEAARQAGMQTLWQDGLAKAAAGLTTLDQVKRVAFAEE